LVRHGVLTAFQAGHLMQGKSKGLVVSGKYRLLDLLGAGGRGRLYLGETMRARRLVALKLLPPALPKAVERSARAAPAAGALAPPNIVRVFDLESDGASHYLVMEYVEARSLYELVDKFGPFAPVRAAHYVSQAALGLQHACEQKFLPDVKPSN